jgi:hypothetical protein
MKADTNLNATAPIIVFVGSGRICPMELPYTGMQQPEVGIFFWSKIGYWSRVFPWTSRWDTGTSKFLRARIRITGINCWRLVRSRVSTTSGLGPASHLTLAAKNSLIGRPLHPRPAEDPGRHHQEATLARQPRDFD